MSSRAVRSCCVVVLGGIAGGVSRAVEAPVRGLDGVVPGVYWL